MTKQKQENEDEGDETHETSTAVQFTFSRHKWPLIYYDAVSETKPRRRRKGNAVLTPVPARAPGRGVLAGVGRGVVARVAGVGRGVVAGAPGVPPLPGGRGHVFGGRDVLVGVAASDSARRIGALRQVLAPLLHLGGSEHIHRFGSLSLSLTTR